MNWSINYGRCLSDASSTLAKRIKHALLAFEGWYLWSGFTVSFVFMPANDLTVRTVVAIGLIRSRNQVIDDVACPHSQCNILMESNVGTVVATCLDNANVTHSLLPILCSRSHLANVQTTPKIKQRIIDVFSLCWSKDSPVYHIITSLHQSIKANHPSHTHTIAFEPSPIER